MQTTDWLSFAVSFAIVLALLGALLYVMKRLQSGSLLGLPQRRIRVLEAVSVAPRQKLLLVRVKDQDILVGVTLQQINTLATFRLTEEEVVADSVPRTTASEGSNSLTPLAKRLSEMLKSAQDKDKV
jgi:flagellar protein FliO/FliZ